MGLSFRFLWVLFLWALRDEFLGGNTTVVLSFVPVANLRHIRRNDCRLEFRNCGQEQITPAARAGNQQWHLISRWSPAMAVGGSSTQSDKNDSDTLGQNKNPTTTKDKKSIRQSPKSIAMPTPKRTWQVWKTISKLEEILSSNHQTEEALYPAPRELVMNIVSILKTLATQHEGKLEWQGLLNKSTLLHEVEESILAIHFLQEEWAKHSNSSNEVVLVDVCCGKGVFSLLASYYFANSNETTTIAESGISIQKIIMLDKDPKLRWDHIHASNQDGKGRPYIECWPRFNLHETDEVVRRLEAQQVPLALVGIHLCKTLSPACIGIANILGPQKCPQLVLAPCCLPRVVVQSKYNHKKTGNNKSKVLEVRQYETQDQRQERRLAQERRARAMVRGNRRNDDNDIVCWKCGEFGHTKAECPSHQSTGKPQLIRPPMVALEVSGILETPWPFGSYCSLLSTSIQRSSVAVEETGLTNNHMSKGKSNNSKQEANNWNRDRKSMYIVASER